MINGMWQFPWTGAFVAVALAGGCRKEAPAPSAAQTSPAIAPIQISTTGPASVADEQVRNLHRDGNILIGGEPTTAGLEALQREGVRTVIDLRTEPDKMAVEAQEARKLGMKYFAIPIKSNQMTDDQAKAVLAAMKQHESGEVFIHCASGNRSAAAYGLYLGAAGQCPVEEALERAKKAGLKNPELTEDVRRHLATQPAAETRPATQASR